ncbi:MAG: PBSX family phage terminase large subunit [Oscillospiraceae bacterium]|jgi:PBSX family phage terminase large subunit|nr:PBSX family phage terminase large subunit [Oscillospiraceae bacterium]
MTNSITCFSNRQRQVLSWWHPESPHQDLDAIICDGAVRSGKTFACGLSFVLWAYTAFETGQFALCGKTILSLRRNLLQSLLPYLRWLGFDITMRLSQNTMTVRRNGREQLFYLFGGRDEGSAALIQGVTLCGVLLDEAALMPRSFVEQACARCSVPGSRLWFNCNPEAPGHWFYTDWIQRRKQRRALYLHFTMDDNPAMTPRVRARYERLYTGVFYDRFVRGRWVAAEGLVYDFFDPAAAPPPPDGPFDRFVVSCDYGTRNPSSFGLWGLQAGIWYRLREYYHDARAAGAQKTDAEYVDALEALRDGRTLWAVVVDPSAASFIEALRRKGYPVVPAKNEVLTGLRATAGLLKTGRLVVCNTCPNILREFSLYRWDTRDGDIPHKENDHAMDDMRYFAATVATRPTSAKPPAIATDR